MAYLHPLRSALPAVLLVATVHTSLAAAQASTGKTVVAKPATVPAQTATHVPGVFAVFSQWADSIAPPAPAAPPANTPVALQAWSMLPASSATPNPNTAYYEPAALILGQPDLPLLGQAAAQAAQQWSSGLNYQGITLSFVVLDSKGKTRKLTPASRPPSVGQRFKIRYTTSFDSVATIDKLVANGPWRLRPLGQAWPNAGQSVQAAAGETVELPMQANQYFQMSDKASERIVLHIRHPQAKNKARSNQPIYRQDGARASQYLQLVPPGTYPALEQLIVPR